jgi:hypothetical protein
MQSLYKHVYKQTLQAQSTKEHSNIMFCKFILLKMEVKLLEKQLVPIILHREEVADVLCDGIRWVDPVAW